MSGLPDSPLIDEFELDDGFDPFEDSGSDDLDNDEVVEVIGAPGLLQQRAVVVERVDERSDDERIADLLKAMAPQRKSLYGILAYCLQPQRVGSVAEEVERLQENNYSVFKAADLSKLLEQAGAIHQVSAEGNSLEQVKVEPEVIVEDGVEYLKPGTPPEIYWVTTDAGRAALDADKPLERMTELFDSDSAYLPIYKRILELCAREGGILTKELGVHVDSDPLVQKPRLYAPRFIDRLEKCDAVTWKKTWVTTDIGEKGLELLAAVTDDYTPPTPAEILAATQTVPAALSVNPADLR
ncbi:MAG: hypothetical protein LBS98_05345 [Coriobacteriales bacterium]|jgi:hypothetical protein|nr:hypothetical protein [Coriobacteriales bacterium]